MKTSTDRYNGTSSPENTKNGNDRRRKNELQDAVEKNNRKRMYSLQNNTPVILNPSAKVNEVVKYVRSALTGVSTGNTRYKVLKFCRRLCEPSAKVICTRYCLECNASQRNSKHFQ